MAIIYVGTEHKTISAAIQAAKDGDTVVVSGGVYRGCDGHDDYCGDDFHLIPLG